MTINILPLIPARYYLKILELLNERAIPLQEFFEVLNLELEKFTQLEEQKFSLQQIEKLIELCLKYPQNYDLAFELAKVLKLSSHSLVGYVLLTSETLKQALKLLSQYFKLIIPNFKLTMREDAQSIWLIFEPTMPMSHLNLNFHLEAIAVAFYHNLNELVGTNIFHHHIYLSLSAPRHLDRYHKLSWANFHFQALSSPSIQVVLSKQYINTPLPMADQNSLNIVEQQCQELMQHITFHGEIVPWVQMMLLETYHMPTLNECAKLLNTSTKTLQRHLKKQGTDFQTLKKQVMLERAKQLLQHAHRNVTDIADELGYTSASNFARAFRAHTQLTPLEYRQQCLG